MNRPSRTEAREWLAAFLEQYRAGEKLIDLSALSDLEIAMLMGGEKIKTFNNGKK